MTRTRKKDFAKIPMFRLILIFWLSFQLSVDLNLKVGSLYLLCCTSKILYCLSLSNLIPCWKGTVCLCWACKNECKIPYPWPILYQLISGMLCLHSIEDKIIHKDQKINSFLHIQFSPAFSFQLLHSLYYPYFSNIYKYSVFIA